MNRISLALILTSLCLSAAEGGASITPAPGFEPTRTGPSPQQRPMSQPPMMMPRPAMAFEVELLTVKPGDTAALAQWAELAALGFHVVAAVPGDGQVSVYLERSMMGGVPGSLRLPGNLDEAQAGSLRQRIESAMNERQRLQPPRPPVPPTKPSEGQR
jgi:hypothetical protein